MDGVWALVIMFFSPYMEKITKVKLKKIYSINVTKICKQQFLIKFNCKRDLILFLHVFHGETV